MLSFFSFQSYIFVKFHIHAMHTAAISVQSIETIGFCNMTDRQHQGECKGAKGQPQTQRRNPILDKQEQTSKKHSKRKTKKKN